MYEIGVSLLILAPSQKLPNHQYGNPLFPEPSAVDLRRRQNRRGGEHPTWQAILSGSTF